MKNGHFTLNKSHFSQWQLDRLDQPNQTSHNHYLNIFEVPPPQSFLFSIDHLKEAGKSEYSFVSPRVRVSQANQEIVYYNNRFIIWHPNKLAIILLLSSMTIPLTSNHREYHVALLTGISCSLSLILQLSDSTEWALTALESFKDKCWTELRKDETSVVPPDAFCDNECNFHGRNSVI